MIKLNAAALDAFRGAQSAIPVPTGTIREGGRRALMRHSSAGSVNRSST